MKARAGRDYTTTSGTATFAPGTTTQTINIPVIGDQHIEDTETFAVNLSNSWATVTDAQRIGTIATDDAFTDATLTVYSTAVKAVHFAELRTQIDLLRAVYGLGTYGWTGLPPAPGMAPIAAHITDARAALAAVHPAAAQSAPTYTDPGLATGYQIRAAHVQELRTAIKVAP